MIRDWWESRSRSDRIMVVATLAVLTIMLLIVASASRDHAACAKVRQLTETGEYVTPDGTTLDEARRACYE